MVGAVAAALAAALAVALAAALALLATALAACARQPDFWVTHCNLGGTDLGCHIVLWGAAPRVGS